MSQHEELEVMCAMAVIGQSNDVELSELDQHLETCAECRERLADFAQISAQALLIEKENYSRAPRQMIARFVIRARAEGIPLTALARIRPHGSPLWRWQTVLAAALLLIVVLGGIAEYIELRPPSPAKTSPDAANTAKVRLTNQAGVPSASSKSASKIDRQPHARTVTAAERRNVAEPATPVHEYILTGSSSEYGRTTSGVINVIPKTGVASDVNRWARFYDLTFGHSAQNGSVDQYGLNPYRNGNAFEGGSFSSRGFFTPSSVGYELYTPSEYGATMGGPILLVTKSGRNSMLYGSSFYYFEAGRTALEFTVKTTRCQDSPDLLPALHFSNFTSFRRENLSYEIDWHERWLERIAAQFRDGKDSLAFNPALPLNISSIDWHERWLRKSFATKAKGKIGLQCPLLPPGRIDFTLTDLFEAKHP